MRDEWKSNNLLSVLRHDDLELLLPHFRTLTTDTNAVLYDHGQNVETVYFPRDTTLASFMISTEDGTIVEALIVGREGAVGGIVSQGRLPAYSRTMVQHGGDFLTLPVSILDDAKKKSRTLDNLFARYADCVLAQILQSTACNAAHNIEQRTAKWIVSAMERTHDDEVPLTQERLSSMLGVGRSYVSRVMARFKDDGILMVRRGHILIRDKARLEARACHCNETVKAHFNDVLKGVYPDSE
jgi:Crp-like helix-turn-helix domain